VSTGSRSSHVPPPGDRGRGRSALSAPRFPRALDPTTPSPYHIASEAGRPTLWGFRRWRRGDGRRPIGISDRARSSSGPRPPFVQLRIDTVRPFAQEPLLHHGRLEAYISRRPRSRCSTKERLVVVSRHPAARPNLWRHCKELAVVDGLAGDPGRRRPSVTSSPRPRRQHEVDAALIRIEI